MSMSAIFCNLSNKSRANVGKPNLRWPLPVDRHFSDSFADGAQVLTSGGIMALSLRCFSSFTT